MAWNPCFEAAFRPRAVAVAGASRDPGIRFDFVAVLQQAGFAGNIYPVNPKADGSKINGLKVYPDLASIPEPVDLVIVSVPSPAVPTVLEDCITANITNVHIFTAGFKETGQENGIELERRIQEIADKGGLCVVGPNCMGLHIPAARVTTWPAVAFTESGSVAMLSQSGGHAGQFVRLSSQLGVGLSKVVSYGNASVLDGIDFLEYLATDSETQIICMYMEGTRDGGKLTAMVREINKHKPVIVWKGGLTEWGSRAVFSHTGSLGGEKQVWDAFYRQTGAIRADSVEELVDLAIAFRYLAPPSGRRAALMGAGGGNSVAGADVCAREGLELPLLRTRTLEELKKIIPSDGTFIRNPLDIGVVIWDINLLLQALEPVAADPVIDTVIFSQFVGVPPRLRQTLDVDAQREFAENQAKTVMDRLIEFAKGNSHQKPLIVVLQEGAGGAAPGQIEGIQQKLLREGIPAYRSLERASRALSRFLQYHEFHKRAGEG